MLSENQYLDLYQSSSRMIKKHSAEALNAVRDAAFEDFRRLGFPSRKVERYPHMYDGKSKEQGDDDDLHHIGFAEWKHGIVWKHVDYLVHECNVVYLDVAFSCWQLDEWEVALQTSGNYKTLIRQRWW